VVPRHLYTAFANPADSNRWLRGTTWERVLIRNAARSRLLRRVARTVVSIDSAAVAEQYAVELQNFNAHMRSRGIHDIQRYYWYHAVNLPGDGVRGGITTPGMYDYRFVVDAFQFPDNMRGMSVLDVGSATGYFAFEFERRGAHVVSVDLPTLEQLDRFPGQDTSSLLRKMLQMGAPQSPNGSRGVIQELSAQELHYYLIEAPFQLCSRLLGSRVERRYCTIYELSFERLGRLSFDYVFVGDVLLHTLRPFDALASVARMCSGTLVIAQFMPGSPRDRPAIFYEGGEILSEDDICWWLPNEQCFCQLLRKLGFAEVIGVGNYAGIHRPAGNMYSRRIIHAKRSLTVCETPASVRKSS
jgi:SAM-dependent methyltransferase